MKRLLTLLICATLTFNIYGATKERVLTSPNGLIEVIINTDNQLTYRVLHDTQLMIDNSPIAMRLSDGTIYGDGDKVKKVTRRDVDNIVECNFYKKSKIVEKYNELSLKFKEFTLIFRAYDSGVAYRFISHSKVPFEVIEEVATFNFPENSKGYIPYVNARKYAPDKSQYYTSFESQYSYTLLSDWQKGRLSITPLMVEAKGGKKINITEADLLNYPGMFLIGESGSSTLKGEFAPYPDKTKQGGHNMLQDEVYSRKPYIAKCNPEEIFPWRVIAISSEDVKMADNDLVYLLASPQEEESDFSWVKPGKVAWDWWNDWNLYGVDFKAGINNDTYKYYIDFASKEGIEYVILDEGWAVNKKADLFQVVPEIDLEELVKYATERNVGLILWAGYIAFDREMERVCKHYSEMGIKGFKVDFMDRDDQVMVDFHHRAAKMAAKYKMMIDFHGTYKPTGLHRKYPNVINYEGVFGLEQMKWSDSSIDQVTYDVTVPYIRMMAGPMDYTQGAMKNATRRNYRPVNSEAMSQGTRCRQLAQYVIFESPLNMLCDSPSNYLNERESLDYISSIPTVWEETVAIDGKVGEYIIMARRSGDEWYIGGMTNWNARDIKIDLSFLPSGSYQIELFKDGVNAERAARDYKREIFNINSSDQLDIHLASGGGFAAKISIAK